MFDCSFLFFDVVVLEFGVWAYIYIYVVTV